MFDSKVPSSLLKTQKWFSHIIETSLEKDNHLPSHIAQDSNEYIAPSPTLTARERIEIYHQQYWWRLLETMQENYPSVTRLFGYHEFNIRLAVPYLSSHPAQSFALNKLGDSFCDYLKKTYANDDKNLVHAMAEIDYMVNFSFTAAHFPLQAISPEEMINTALGLQPHIFLYKAQVNFLTFRENFLKNPPEYYESNPFPELPNHPTYAIIHRSINNDVVWKFLSEPEYTLLSMIHGGMTISSACESIEQRNFSLGDEVAVWFYEWVSSQWFAIKKPI